LPVVLASPVSGHRPASRIANSESNCARLVAALYLALDRLDATG
jgi:hypothetical protein